jgi:hypothetical protein
LAWRDTHLARFFAQPACAAGQEAIEVVERQRRATEAVEL